MSKTRQTPTLSNLETVTQSCATFGDTLTRLEVAYHSLESRVQALNHELEETNNQLQQNLAEKEHLSAYLHNTLESLGSGVLAIDTKGNISRLNRAATAILQVSSHEAIGKPCAELLGNASADLLHTLASGMSVQGREKILLHPDGGKTPVQYSTLCLHDASGEIMGAVETFEDISKIQELSKQASRVSTLTALGEMAATVAHEIRNPLGGIGGFAGLLERDLDVDDPRRRLVKKIMEGVTSLNSMVTNLLNYTRPLQLNLRPVNIVEVVEDCLGFFEIDAGTRLDEIELERIYGPEEIPCNTDPEQVQQILLNLLHNAVQAMPSGGRIRIGILEMNLAQQTDLNKPCVALTVTDSGLGMTDEVKAKLFMPFFTTKEDGNGLGLATAKKVIEAHGGDILVESTAHQGATFTILIPR
ncbi:MAG: ATP-binding protein [bacterium]|nr:ATP-binding protein [bacterium]